MRDQAITRFEEGLRRSLRRLIPPGARVLIGVSGGADSVALLSAWERVGDGRRIEVCTVDHGLRVGSADEAAAVARLCGELGVVHHTVTVRLDPGTGLEARAREARYAALGRVRLERGLDLIATAHTANDQAETLLMRLGRGAAGGQALGIHERRPDGVVRPLLFATRAEVLAWLEARGLPFVRDPMNDDGQFLRVRVRRELLPLFEAIAGPHVVEALARHAELAAEDDAFLDARAREALPACVAPDHLRTTPLDALELPVRRRVLASWLTQQGVALDAELIADCLRVAREGGVATLPGDRLLACKNGRATVEASPPRLHATSSSSRGHVGS